MSGLASSLKTMSPRTFNGLVVLIWLIVSAAMMLIVRDQLATGALGDPDNYMRLVQVRDWLNGQAWADLKQHRMNPPVGGDLHWSRLVDMPIALIIMALRPLVGQPMAEWVALLAVPSILYLLLSLVIARLLREVSKPWVALVLVALLPCCLLLNVQFMPMRIDHHGWQLLMAGVALLAWIQTGKRAVIACAIACAFWMHVSIEGLPYALLFAGLYGLAYIHSGDRRVHLYLATLTVATLFFLLVTRGPGLIFETYCDAISAPYLAALMMAVPAFVLVDRIIRPTGVAMRFVPPAAAAVGAVAVIALLAPTCLGGPFATLDPLTRDYWYLSVREGLPFWRQSGPFATMIVLAPLPGVICASVIAYQSRGSDRALVWAGLALAALCAWLIGLMVMRAGGVAQLYALPGMAALIATLSTAREKFRPRVRWSLSMASAILLSTAIPAHTLGAAFSRSETERNSTKDAAACVEHFADPVFKSLGREVVFAPIDAGPLLLYHSDVSIIGAAYHRNSDAIATVIRAFTSPPDVARNIVYATSAQYLLFCLGTPEGKNYASRAPNGLAAELTKGHVPDWLVPDNRMQQPGARLYRVVR